MLRLAFASAIKNVHTGRKVTNTLLSLRSSPLHRLWPAASAFHTTKLLFTSTNFISKKELFSLEEVPETELRHKVFEFDNGDRYEGSAHDDQMYGWGVYLYSDGSKFEGLFRDGLRHTGQGVLKYVDGRVYDGAWAEGRWDGYGKLTYPTGETLEGDFKNGTIINGKGKKLYHNKSFYVGEILDGLRHGYGIMKLEIHTYEGYWRADKRHGHGKLIFPTGQTFEGEFRDNWILSGGGVFISNRTEPPRVLHEPPQEMRCRKVHLHRGDAFEGDWRQCKPEGVGRIVGANGHILQVTVISFRILS